MGQRTSNQAFFSRLLQGIRDEATWGELKRKDLAAPGHREAYVADHAAILSALRARDAEQARDRMRLHLLRVQENLLGSLAKAAYARGGLE